MNSLAVMKSGSSAKEDRPLPLLSASFWIALFSYREMVRRRRLISLGLIMLLPVALVLAWRVWDRDGIISAPLLMANLGGVVYVHMLVAIVSLAVGLSAIGEQISEGTILYYWTRPLGRGAIYMGRLVAAQTVVATLLACSLALCFLVMTVGNSGVVNWSFIKLYVANSSIIIIGSFVYTAVFALLGTWLKKPMMPAVLFAVGWESLSGSVPLRLQELTVVFHLRNLIRNTAKGTDNVPNLLTEIKRALLHEQPVPEWQSALVLLGILILTAALGIWLLRNKEIFR